MSTHHDRWPSRSARVAGRADQVADGQTIASVHAGVVPQATFAFSEFTLNVLEADRGSEFLRYPPHCSGPLFWRAHVLVEWS